MQKSGLEWLYRLIQEPRRMWKRYLVTNTKFIMLCLVEVTKALLGRLFGSPPNVAVGGKAARAADARIEHRQNEPKKSAATAGHKR
jgi:hypothetical protein